MLAHQVLTAGDAPPDRFALFLHGILGRGQNWRSVARRFVLARPEWGAALVDLRLHGDSRHVPGPHTVAAAAADLDEVATGLQAPVRGVLGHSFGGKVALAWADERVKSHPLDALWLLDSPPGARDGMDACSAEVLRVVDALEELTGPFDDRRAFVRAMQGRGFSEALGKWLATNLDRRDDGTFTLGFDLEGIRALLEDYAQKDLWPAVESPPGRHVVQVVVGARSDVFTDDDRRRAARAAEANPRVHLHVLEGAGHWLHVDAPDALDALLADPDAWAPAE